jgi:hypothetical protein
MRRLTKACIAAGLVGGECFAVDVSVSASDANQQRSIPRPAWKKDPDPFNVRGAL